MNISGLGSILGVAGELFAGAGASGVGGATSPLGGLASLAEGLLSGGAGAGSAGSASPLGGLASLAESLLGGGGDDGSTSGTSSGASSDPFSAIAALTGSVDKLATGGLSSLLGSAGGLGSIAGLLA